MKKQNHLSGCRQRDAPTRRIMRPGGERPPARAQMEALKKSEIKSSIQHESTASELEDIKSRLAEIERTRTR
jgi:hypothetical protein